MALDYHLVGDFAAARGERPAVESVTGVVGQFVRRVSGKRLNLCIYHVGAVGVRLTFAKIGVVDNVGSRGGILVLGSQSNIAADRNGLAGLVGIAVAARPAGEVVAMAIQKDFRLRCFGKAAALIGLGVLVRVLAVFLIGHRIRGGVTGEHGLQRNRRIQFGVYVKQRSVLFAPGNGFLATICRGKGGKHILVARGVGKGVAVGNGKGFGFAVHIHGEVNSCHNRLGLPHRVGCQTTGGHGFGKLKLLGTFGIGEPPGKLESFGRSLRSCRVRRQGIYRLIVLVVKRIYFRTIFVQEGDIVGVTGVVEFCTVIRFAFPTLCYIFIEGEAGNGILIIDGNAKAAFYFIRMIKQIPTS